MIERYEDPKIAAIWTDEAKLKRWQKTELAVIRADVDLGNTPRDAYDRIRKALARRPIDIAWWKARDKEIHHDLNAFLDERLRHLLAELHEYWHKIITSYDTEEPAFTKGLIESLKVIDELYERVDVAIEGLARKYRYTIMLAKTHRQDAELKTFGARCLTWLKELRQARKALAKARKELRFSKISGAVGNYGPIDPELERKALGFLGFNPFYGATQIMPRIIHAPVGDALSYLVQVLDKIATDIRLNSGGSRPLTREPFGKKQKGSSAMPQKKNQIRLENVGGMARMADTYASGIRRNIQTWEERDISQSSVERVFWPDLFHVVASALKTMGFVLEGLNVYPDNMAEEVHLSRGTYATVEVKAFLKERVGGFGLTHEDAYRMVQLAAFNVFEPSKARRKIRNTIPSSIVEGVVEVLYAFMRLEAESAELYVSIQDFIPSAELRTSEELEISAEQVAKYNETLRQIFDEPGAREDWNICFDPIYLLQHEEVLYREILGE